ncbi:hypothetical protein L3Y34_003175 [Caenorhabditis briggsae]|uniref:Uncharacterized protein n=1 Tax=Caenorhabditis briggsae TaxID=6238 RepID=A0AAE9A9R6_CAEBR|nr:hypothetical protein L3Y34_003175 [Caenorhabditis briggsae]
MDKEEHEDRIWIEYLKGLEQSYKEFYGRWKAERRAKRREERKLIKEKIRKQKKQWKLAQDRSRAAQEKDRRYRKKVRASRRKKVQWLKKRNWLPMRIFHLFFWIRPMNMLICNASQICYWGLLSIELHVSKYRSKKKRKKAFSR